MFESVTKSFACGSRGGQARSTQPELNLHQMGQNRPGCLPRFGLVPANGAPRSRIQVWLWPNVLSLDAPLVAILWQMFFAECLRVRVDPVTTAVLGLGVWLIYVADRILDGLTRPSSRCAETVRHEFHRVNRMAMLPWTAVALLIAAWLSVGRLDHSDFRNYFILALGVSIYFTIVHLGPESVQSHWPKELAVAVLFGLGVFLPVWTDLKSHAIGMLMPFVLFGAVLWINAVAIDYWESRQRNTRPCGPNATQLLGRHLGIASAFVALAAVYLMLIDWTAGEKPLYGAIAISSVSLAALHLIRGRLSDDLLRVLADATLLSPILLLGLLLLR